MPRLKEGITVCITTGDWSGDGHGKYDQIKYAVNYPISELRDAYKKSCKATGIQFTHNTDYTGLGKNYDNIWTEYQDCDIRPGDANTLKEHGILNDAFLTEHNLREEDDGTVTLFTPIDAADLIMRFISYSMPKDFIYMKIADPNPESINGWWNHDLNCQFGYGLYD